jgi:ABC-type multidrug transport system ATPase subunit
VEPLIGRGTHATRVLTSHDPASAVAEADLVLGLSAGGQAFFGPPAELSASTVTELYR